MSISVNVIRFDSKAFGNGQLQAIRKQPPKYEFYVVNSRVPVEQPRLTVPETVQQYTHVVAEGSNNADLKYSNLCPYVGMMGPSSRQCTVIVR